jgi:hypothetical protein
MASVIALSVAHNQGGRLRYVFYTWSLLAVVILFLEGSKGPVLAWVIGVGFVMRFAGKQKLVRSLAAVGIIASVIGGSALSGYSPIPCGMVRQFSAVSHSQITRMNLAGSALDTFISPKSSGWLPKLVGNGFGASNRSVNPETGQILTHSGSLNLFMDMLTETGGIGLALFLLALTLLVVSFVRDMRRQSSGDWRLLMPAMGGVLIIVLVKLMVAAETHTEDLGALLIGLLMGSAVYVSPEKSTIPAANIATDAAESAGKS